MDNFATRFFYDTDGAALSRWSHVAYEYYSSAAHSEWGFAIASGIALVATTWMVLKVSGPLAYALAYPFRRFRAYKGRQGMRRSRRKFVEQWASDKVTDLLDNGMIAGVISRKECQELTDKIGKAWSIKDLIPRTPVKARMGKLKHRLKSKFKDKIVDINKARKERDEARAKPMTLKDRLEQQRKAV